MSEGERMKISKILLFSTCVLMLSGCSTIKESVKCGLGVSTKVLKTGRQTAIKKKFNLSYAVCHAKVRKILKDSSTYIYAENSKEKLIAIYVSSIETTPVGIFFNEIDSNCTEIEISSPSSSAKELIANRIFTMLEVNREGSIKKEFNLNYSTCDKSIREFIKDSEITIYSQDQAQKFIAIYAGPVDFTPVWIFFNEIDNQNTEIEISSPNSKVKEEMSKKIFKAIEISAEKTEK